MNNKKSKTAFSNFDNNKRLQTKHSCHMPGPFMTEFGEDIISEVVENEIKVKPKKKKITKKDK